MHNTPSESWLCLCHGTLFTLKCTTTSQLVDVPCKFQIYRFQIRDFENIAHVWQALSRLSCACVSLIVSKLHIYMSLGVTCHRWYHVTYTFGTLRPTQTTFNSISYNENTSHHSFKLFGNLFLTDQKQYIGTGLDNGLVPIKMNRQKQLSEQMIYYADVTRPQWVNYLYVLYRNVQRATDQAMFRVCYSFKCHSMGQVQIRHIEKIFMRDRHRP